MKAKILRNKSLDLTLLYNLKDASHVLQKINLLGKTHEENIKEMILRERLFSGRAKNLVAHMIISPIIEIGRLLSHLEWLQIINRLTQKMKLTDYKAIWFLHTDKNHFHLHGVACRISSEGKIYRPLVNERVLIQISCDEIAEELGFENTSKSEKIENEGLFKSIKKRLDESIAVSFDNYDVFNKEFYFKQLEERELKVVLKVKNGITSGYGIKINKRYYGATAFGRKYSLNSLLQSNLKSEIVAREFASDLERAIDEVIQKHQSFKQEVFFEILRSLNYEITIHYKNDTAERLARITHGYSVSKHGISFTASELGKSYTLTALKKKYKAYKPKNYKDLSAIGGILLEITNGKTFDSLDDIINVLTTKHIKAYSRFENKKIVGFNVNMGRDTYQEWEIGNGQYELSKLLQEGKIQTIRKNVYKERSETASGIFQKFAKIKLKERFTSDLQAEVRKMTMHGKNFTLVQLFDNLRNKEYEIKYNQEMNKNEYVIKKNSVEISGTDMTSECTIQNLLKLELFFGPKKLNQDVKINSQNDEILMREEIQKRIQEEAHIKFLILERMRVIMKKEINTVDDFIINIKDAELELLNRNELNEKLTTEYIIEYMGVNMKSSDMGEEFKLGKIISQKINNLHQSPNSNGRNR